MFINETIAAISTPMSSGGIGIIRISGKDAFDVIDKIYKSKSGNKIISEQKTHTIHFGYIVDKKEVLDEVLVSIMKGTNSYTGDNTIEINCHGGVFVLNKVLELVLKNGARPAQPGEFTKRAFLNGKIDLSQAEAVMDLINSKNSYAHKSSITNLKGSIQDKINELREKILYHTAFIESALDDPEHISLDGYSEELYSDIKLIDEELMLLVNSFENGRLIREGIKTVIVGKPNAGKSSLLNRLVGDEKAIVTNIEGTTRDALEEFINIGGITLNIVDTAGIRDTDDIVEKIGVKKAIDYAEDCDLLIYVVDVSRKLDNNDINIIKLCKNKKTIILLNKSDLKSVVNENDLYENGIMKNVDIINISASKNIGIDNLESCIKQLFLLGEVDFNDEVFISNNRQKNAINEALISLKKVKESIESGMPEDFYSIDLIDAYENLGNIMGETIGEDLVNEIFSKFCMGK